MTQEMQIDALMERLDRLSRRVVDLERKVEFLLSHEPTPYRPPSEEQVSAVERQVADLLKKGKTLEAIKAYRQVFDVELEVAKQRVEEIRDRIGTA